MPRVKKAFAGLLFGRIPCRRAFSRRHETKGASPPPFRTRPFVRLDRPFDRFLSFWGSLAWNEFAQDLLRNFVLRGMCRPRGFPLPRFGLFQGFLPTSSVFTVDSGSQGKAKAVPASIWPPFLAVRGNAALVRFGRRHPLRMGRLGRPRFRPWDRRSHRRMPPLRILANRCPRRKAGDEKARKRGRRIPSRGFCLEGKRRVTFFHREKVESPFPLHHRSRNARDGPFPLRILFLCLAAFVPFFRCRHGFGHSDLPVFDATGPFVLLIRRLFGQKESRASFPRSLDGRAKQEVHFTYEIG